MFPKFSAKGETTTGKTPCPVMVTQSGDDAALLGKHSVACSCVVVVEGTKVTKVVQDEAGATVAPVQPVSFVKSAEFAPLIVGVPTTRLAVPTFDTVSAREPEVRTLPNARFAGLRFTCGVGATTLAEACVELALVPAELVALTT